MTRDTLARADRHTRLPRIVLTPFFAIPGGGSGPKSVSTEPPRFFTRSSVLDSDDLFPFALDNPVSQSLS
jgi:hypothetical protein